MPREGTVVQQADRRTALVALSETPRIDMTFAMGTTLALWTLTASAPTNSGAYTLDISVQGPRSESYIRPYLVEAFAPCIENPRADVTLTAVVDQGGGGEVSFTYALFADVEENGAQLPDDFNRLTPQDKQAALDRLVSCLDDFYLEDLRLPVIPSRRPTTIEARLIFSP
ncbi:MAG: hypothetical protein CL927_11420 [Deltaproteobacteria bacterium]|nr:hypothetical protein [Deltaproteobacteria bacterium]HCH63802.1 hypothetical protein [Deltaproteobacteria bacterium]